MPAGNQVTNTPMTSNHLSCLPIKMGCYFMAGTCFGPNRKRSWNGSNLQCKHPNFKMIATFIDCRCIKHLKTDQNRDNKQDYTTRHDANIDPALALDSVPESAQSFASVALSKSEETPKPVIHCNTIFWEAINPSYCEQKGYQGFNCHFVFRGKLWSLDCFSASKMDFQDSPFNRRRAAWRRLQWERSWQYLLGGSLISFISFWK